MSEQKQIIHVKSKYINDEVFVGVVIPKRIDKLLLLLHGYNSSFKNLDDNLPLIEYANDNNMIIVTPNMNNGYYLNKDDYNVNEFVNFELLPLILKRYKLSKDIAIYIAGISMGGYGSLLIGSAFLEKFRRIVSISGAFIAHDVAIGNPQVVGRLGDRETLKYFTETFAPFDTLENDKCRNPIAAIINCDTGIVPGIILTCGTNDILYERNLDAIKEFDKHGIVYDWLPVEGGLHNYEAFDVGLRYAFKVLD